MKASIDDLHPTQIAVGYQQVDSKLTKLKDMNDKKFNHYLKSHLVPCVIGPDKKLYMVDHHHLCLACHKLEVKDVYIEILKDWSYMSLKDFWSHMLQEKYIWLFDENGHDIDFEYFHYMLPQNVQGLKDDPYRSIAGIVRKKGGYSKDYTPFSEFAWANLFRSHINLSDNVITSETIEQAMTLCKSPLTTHLPGYSYYSPL